MDMLKCIEYGLTRDQTCGVWRRVIFSSNLTILVIVFKFSVELSDDRNESFLGALRQNIGPDTQLVMCIVPTNKKDRYDAIKKFTCVDHPGMESSSHSFHGKLA